MALALVAGAGMIATALSVGLILIVWLGHWTVAVEALRMGMLAKVSIAMAILMGASMVGLLIAGPLNKMSGKIGESELTVEGDRD